MNYFHLFLVSFSATIFAQETPSIPSISIPKAENNTSAPALGTPQYSISKPFVPQRFKTAQKFEPISMDKPMQIQPQISDLNPSDQYVKKLTKSYQAEFSGNVKKENIYFGQIKTNSESIIIMYRDFSEVDSDYISVTIGETLLVRQTMLNAGFKFNNVGLVMGKNSITFTAINEGEAPPNTAEFKILDDRNNVLYNSQWALKKDYKAIIDIIRE